MPQTPKKETGIHTPEAFLRRAEKNLLRIKKYVELPDDDYETFVDMFLSQSPKDAKPIPFAVVNAGMLGILQQLPPDAGNILTSGIDDNVMSHDEEFSRKLGQEISRVVGEKHFWIRAYSDITPAADAQFFLSSDGGWGKIKKEWGSHPDVEIYTGKKSA